ncbi:Spermidine/putrescine import ATP-binding protein PotA [Nocardia asteroides]|nr:Inner membrane component of T3SS domain-containing protein [Nocardia asteroides]VEG35182.1 Spermidine/putrescine import ATP-binding protein PotA [Nocardia asteroides]
MSGHLNLVLPDGTTHHIAPDRPVVVGHGPDADIATGTGPSRWLRLRYAGVWTLTVLDPQIRLVESGTQIPPEADGSTRVRVRDGETRRLKLMFAGSEYTIEAALNPTASAGVAPPPIPAQPPMSAPTPIRSPAVPVGPNIARGSGRSIALTQARTSIGRTGHGADIQIGGDDVAAVHARVIRTSTGTAVRDLSQGSGTFLDGRPIIQAALEVGDQFIIGHTRFRLVDANHLEFADLTLGEVLAVDSLTAGYDRSVAQAKIADVSFTVESGLLAVIGPSGAGKSTLCNAILGEATVFAGSATLGEIDLIGGACPDPVLVSFVPQGIELFEELTVYDTMWFAARLRLARDVTHDEIGSRIDGILEKVHLTAQHKSRVSTLSGGQKRRVNIALELITTPALLMLDEPSSGLDDGLDRSLMNDLAELAQSGCMVVVVTHATPHLGIADSVAAFTCDESGKQPSTIGFVGRPADLSAGLGASSTADVFDRLRSEKAPALLPEQPVRPNPTRPRTQFRRGGSVSGGHAFRVFFSREVARIRLQWNKIAAMVFAVPLTGPLIAYLASPRGLEGSKLAPNPDLAIVLAVNCILAAFFAMSLSVPTVVADHRVIWRERRWGLPISSAILARAGTRSLLAVGQATTMTLALALLCSGPEDPIGPLPWVVSVWLILASLAVAAVCVGTMISTCAKSMDTAVRGMSAVLALCVVFSGVVVPLGQLSGGAVVLSWVSYLSPVRWAIAGFGSVVGIEEAGTLRADMMWSHDVSHFYIAIGVLVAISVTSLGASIRWGHMLIRHHQRR